MKKRIIQLAGLLLLTTGTYAQTEVTAGVMRGKDYGVTYLLPKTEIQLTIVATKHTYTPGEFCKYAEQFLKLTGISPLSREYWTLDKIQTSTIGVPDKDKERTVYLNNACLRAIRDYLKKRPNDGVKDRALFLSSRNQRISPKTVQHIVYTNLDKAGLSDRGLSVHKAVNHFCERQ